MSAKIVLWILTFLLFCLRPFQRLADWIYGAWWYRTATLDEQADLIDRVLKAEKMGLSYEQTAKWCLEGMKRRGERRRKSP